VTGHPSISRLESGLFAARAIWACVRRCSSAPAGASLSTIAYANGPTSQETSPFVQEKGLAAILSSEGCRWRQPPDRRGAEKTRSQANDAGKSRLAVLRLHLWCRKDPSQANGAA